ncbi:MAG TPA: hypothetical protein DCL54_16645 [Alphaproteobacteria bacterium]|nr:hypothetical protein [Alphaproteobacteria bacterium]HAJ48204.1 hypothetical protein [Alphaproteobacteria bacterium]
MAQPIGPDQLTTDRAIDPQDRVQLNLAAEMPGLSGKLAQLRDKYILGLTMRLKECDAALASCERLDEDNTMATRACFAAFHDMKGQGGMFGFDVIGDIGALVCKHLRHREAVNSDEVHALKQCIAAVRRTLADDGVNQSPSSNRITLKALETLFYRRAGYIPDNRTQV